RDEAPEPGFAPRVRRATFAHMAGELLPGESERTRTAGPLPLPAQCPGHDGLWSYDRSRHAAPPSVSSRLGGALLAAPVPAAAHLTASTGRRRRSPRNRLP